MSEEEADGSAMLRMLHLVERGPERFLQASVALQSHTQLALVCWNTAQLCPVLQLSQKKGCDRK